MTIYPHAQRFEDRRDHAQTDRDRRLTMLREGKSDLILPWSLNPIGWVEVGYREDDEERWFAWYSTRVIDGHFRGSIGNTRRTDVGLR